MPAGEGGEEQHGGGLRGAERRDAGRPAHRHPLRGERARHVQPAGASAPRASVQTPKSYPTPRP